MSRARMFDSFRAIRDSKVKYEMKPINGKDRKKLEGLGENPKLYYRAVAGRDFDNVKAGDKGPLLRFSLSIPFEGDAWADEDTVLGDYVRLEGNTRVYNSFITNTGKIEDTTIRDSRIDSTNMTNSTVDECKLTAGTLVNSGIHYSKAYSSNISNSNLMKSDCSKAEVHGSTLEVAVVNNSEVRGSVLKGDVRIEHGSKVIMSNLNNSVDVVDSTLENVDGINSSIRESILKDCLAKDSSIQVGTRIGGTFNDVEVIDKLELCEDDLKDLVEDEMQL